MKGQKVIHVAFKEVGNVEKPKNSNKTKYGAWFGLDGVAWCGVFVSWAYAHAGVLLGNIGLKKGFAGCQTAVAHFKKTGEITKEPQVGDVVFLTGTVTAGTIIPVFLTGRKTRLKANFTLLRVTPCLPIKAMAAML